MIKWFKAPYTKMSLKEMHTIYDGKWVFTDRTGVPVSDDSVYIIGLGDRNWKEYEEMLLEAPKFKHYKIMGAKREGLEDWLY